ncbi:GNAT family N-acetyltransferase [Guyparkeria sp.]|uniref:GNAT family N-acetyltransferase n=1 Tax=Guyparkeria sp. TaxID=2035736 RepID=UPI0039708C53
MLAHRPVEKPDLARTCSFLRSEEELFHAYPKAVFPLTPAQLQQAIDQRRDPTVVEHDETVVGFANFYRWEGGICCFGNVAVAPRARGRGVGQYFIRTMIGLARENHGATEGRVSCFNANVGGLLLYTKLGFEPFSVEERWAAGGADSHAWASR